MAGSSSSLPGALEFAYKKLRRLRPGSTSVRRPVEHFVHELCKVPTWAGELERRAGLIRQRTAETTDYGKAKRQAPLSRLERPKKLCRLQLDIDQLRHAQETLGRQASLALLTDVIRECNTLENLLGNEDLTCDEEARRNLEDWLDACRNIQFEAEYLRVDGCYFLRLVSLNLEAGARNAVAFILEREAELDNEAKGALATGTEEEREEVDTGGLLESMQEAADSLVKWIGEGVTSEQTNTSDVHGEAPEPLSADSGSATEAANDPTEFQFKLSGNTYFIAGFGEQGHVKRLKGFDQIATLIRSPGKGVPMMDLSGGSRDARLVADSHSRQPALDERARAEIEDDLVFLRETLEKAKSGNNHAEIEWCEAEIKKIADSLAPAVGIGGKSRDLNDMTSKLRRRIHGTLKTAYEKLRTAAPPMNELADHFEASISAESFSYVYRPVEKHAQEWSE